MRLTGHDYAQSGAYFVTVCTHGREPGLGDVVDGKARLSAAGRVVLRARESLPDRFPSLALDAFVVMPNHVHGIVFLGANPDAEAEDTHTVGALLAAPFTQGGVPNAGTAPRGIVTPTAEQGAASSAPTLDGEPGAADQIAKPPPSLGAVMRAFKSLSAIEANRVFGRSGEPFWQRSFHDRIGRSGSRGVDAMRRYIAANPARWEQDDEYPNRGAGHTTRQ